MTEGMIYLDNAATTFPKAEEVYKAMDMANRNLAVNAGRGSYQLAREANKLIDDTKELLLRLVNAPNQARVVFTPSVTIALNEILNGIRFEKNDVVYVSPYEHNAVARTLRLIKKKRNIKIIEMPLNPDTLEIDIEKLKYQFSKDRPTCVCSTHVSNVTGYILPVQDIFQLAKDYNAITVMDAAQSTGCIDINASTLEADFVAFAGHKTLYGPFGIAGFIDVNQIELDEYIVGGTGSDSLNLDMPEFSPNKYETASSNIVAIAGLKVALEGFQSHMATDIEKKLTEYTIGKLKNITGIQLYLPKNLELHVSIVSFNIEGYKSEDVGMILDQDYGIAVRTGYHCAAYIHKHLKDEEFLGTIRIGIGKFNTIDEIDKLVSAISEIAMG